MPAMKAEGREFMTRCYASREERQATTLERDFVTAALRWKVAEGSVVQDAGPFTWPSGELSRTSAPVRRAVDVLQRMSGTAHGTVAGVRRTVAAVRRAVYGT